MFLKLKIPSNIDTFRRKDNQNKSKKLSQQPSKQQSKEIRITNINSKYKLIHGKDFSNFLDPRDQVLEHTFDYKITIKQQCRQKIIKGDYIELDIVQDILQNIKHFLVEAINNVISTSFVLLYKQKLTQFETKAYVSKNIMLNLHSIFYQTTNSIEKGITGAQFPEDENLKIRSQLQQIFNQIAIEIDHILANILQNLSDYYPQAMPVGGSPKMRQSINEVNKSQNQQDDFFCANNHKISEYLNLTKSYEAEDEFETIDFQNENYTKFIMITINKIIQIFQSDEHHKLQRTTRQIFNQFNQKIFWICQQPNYQIMISKFQDKQILNQNQKQTKQKIVQYFQTTFGQSKQEEQIQETYFNLENQLKIVQNSAVFAFKSKFKDKFKQIIKNSNKGIQLIRTKKKYLIGQKIPNFVRVFTPRQIDYVTFSANHGSILRVLTKWMQNLESIFQHPEQFVHKRLYRFKTIHNQMITLKEGQEGKEKLIRQLKEEYRHVKAKMKIVQLNNYELICKYLRSNQSFSSFLNRYSQTRTLASKINSILISLTLKYTNILIHHLLCAGRQIKDIKNKIKNVNLVVFKICDLLRAKFQCSETSFITVLKTFYLLDSSPQMKDKFKLIRIKNKLDGASNNIIINYLFRGKIQCQLQLSLQQAEGKQKSYYTINHFMYQLIRGKFGAIAECAVMISQLQPMPSSIKDKQLASKKKITFRRKEEMISTLSVTQTKLYEQLQQLAFTCQSCKREIVNQSVNIFIKKKQKKCYDCIILTQFQPEQQLKNNQLKDFIIRNSPQKFYRIKSYDQLKYLKDNDCLSIVSPIGSLYVFLIIHVQSDLKTYMLRLTDKIINSSLTQSLDYDNLDIIDLQMIASLSKNTPLNHLVYKINKFVKDGEKFFGFKIQHLKQHNLQKIGNLIKQFKVEKNIIQAIKFSSQIISSSKQQKKWHILQKVVQFFKADKMLKNSLRQTNNHYMLKYRRYKRLNLSSVKQIQGNNLNLFDIPIGLKQFRNLTLLSLTNNNLVKISQQQLPNTLLAIDLSSNKIESIQLSHLTNLNSLVLKRNNLKTLSVLNLQKLSTLNLKRNQLANLDLVNLYNLVSLNLGFNKLTNVDLNKLTNIQQLYLQDNRLKTLNISRLYSIQTLYAGNNQLTQIHVEHLKRLKSLNLKNNKIRNINLSNLSNLTNIHLGFNQITEINLLNLINLNFINLKHNLFKNINLSQLTHLNDLQISDNHLQNIDLVNLISLIHINLENNALNAVDLQNQKMLQKINVSKNRLTQFQLSNMRHLKQLNINQNNIKSIELSQMPNLVELTLKGNQISEAKFDYLDCLRSIILTNQKLQTIEISNLANLLQLNLENNLLNKIFLHNIPQLENLNCSSNRTLEELLIPATVKVLTLDYNIAIRCDYEKLERLEKLNIVDSNITTEQFKNVKNTARIQIQPIQPKDKPHFYSANQQDDGRQLGNP